jgi:hypothetical protein
MQMAADAVVFLTGMPIAGWMILDGMAAHRIAEVGAGLVVAALLGAPSLILAAWRHLQDG